MQITPYIFLNGRCEEAIAFYGAALGAKTVFLQRFKDAPAQDCARTGPQEGIMHAALQIGDSQLFVSDGNGSQQTMSGVSLAISVKNKAEGERIFASLAQDGHISMPFQKTFWAEGFGMLTDRFGIAWMVNCAT